MKKNNTKGRVKEKPQVHASQPVNRWALVIGISDYQHKNNGIQPLKHAHRDAIEFAERLKTPYCMSFPEDNIKRLINQEATLSEVQKALRSFLAKPGKDDLVYIFFSGHGAPDPSGRKQMYLFTHDTDPNDILGTALPMREIHACITDTIQSKNIIVFADACHSGALTNVKSSDRNAEILNQQMQSLNSSMPGTAWLTSSQANQLSREYDDLQHGVFTYYLLQGLSGAADGVIDGIKDGWVTIHELFEYIRKKVSEHTENLQIPTPGAGDFDPALLLAFSGEEQSKDYFAVGQVALQLGEVLFDVDRYHAAAEYFKRIMDLTSGIEYNFQAALYRVKSLTAAGRLGEAIKQNIELIRNLEKKYGTNKADDSEISTLGDALFLLGTLYLMEDNDLNARAASAELKKLSSLFPNHKRITTLQGLIGLRKSSSDIYKPKLYLILVGINQYPDPSAKLNGSINDIDIIQKALTFRWKDIGEIKLIRLIDQEATKMRIEQEFKSVIKNASRLDMFFFHYSGDSVKEPMIVFQPNISENGNSELALVEISATDFHEWMKDIPCLQKFASIDSINWPANILSQLAQAEPYYCLLYASNPGGMAYEIGEYGVFSKALADTLEESTGSDFFEILTRNVKQLQKDQEPLLIGEVKYLFETIPYTYPVILKKVFQRAEFLTTSDVKILLRYFKGIPNFLELHDRLLYSFVNNSLYDLACDTVVQLEVLKALHPGNLPMAIYSCYKHKDHRKSFALLRDMDERTPEVNQEALIKTYSTLLNAPCYALLVGTNDAEESDVRAFAKILTESYGLKQENLTLLLKEEATSLRILNAFEQLTSKSAIGACLFYFAGFGKVSSLDQDSIKGINLPDLESIAAITTSNGQPITFNYLKTITTSNGNSNNLQTIFDIGNLETFNINKDIPQLGDCTLLQNLNSSHKSLSSWFTPLLLRSIQQMSGTPFRISKLLDSMLDNNPDSLDIIVKGNRNRFFFAPDPCLDDEMEKVRYSQFRLAKDIKFQNLLEKEPSAWIEYAYIQHLLGDSKGALRNLEQVRTKLPDRVQLPIGRILCESKDTQSSKWSRAVSELREAPRKNPAVAYFLAKAILGTIEAEQQEEVTQLLEEYASQGYPAGHREEVEAYFIARDPEKQIKVLLKSASNHQAERNIPKAIEELKRAAALGSKEAVRRQMDIFEKSGDLEAAIAMGLELANDNFGNDALRVAKLIAKSLYEPKHLDWAVQVLSQNRGYENLQDWLIKYKEFVKNTPPNQPRGQNTR